MTFMKTITFPLNKGMYVNWLLMLAHYCYGETYFIVHKLNYNFKEEYFQIKKFKEKYLIIVLPDKSNNNKEKRTKTKGQVFFFFLVGKDKLKKKKRGGEKREI